MCFFLPHDDLCRFGCRFVSSSCPETRRKRRTKSSCRQNENNKHQNNISSPTWVTGSDKERNITNHKENHILILVSERDISAIEAIYSFLIFVPLPLYGNCFALSFYPLHSHFSLPQALHFPGFTNLTKALSNTFQDFSSPLFTLIPLENISNVQVVPSTSYCYRRRIWSRWSCGAK